MLALRDGRLRMYADTFAVVFILTVSSCNRELRRQILQTTRVGYGKAVDIWAMGAVVVAMFTGQLPDDALIMTARPLTPPTSDLVNERRMNLVPTRLTLWRHISGRAKRFVQDTLAFEETSRITASQAIDHAWFTKGRHADALKVAYAQAVAGWVGAHRGEDRRDVRN